MCRISGLIAAFVVEKTVMKILRLENLAFLDRGPYSFSVHGSQCCGVSGGSGSGKTLLLRAIADLDPHTGKIFLGDMECDRTYAPMWRKRVGMLPAESSWWFDSVGEHFSRLAKEDEQRLGQLGFGKDVFAWQIQRLSSGEKQRLALLRLLANNPEALLLDEPTASLDADNIARVEKMLVSYCRDSAIPVLWVSHDISQLKRVADRCMIMQADGRLVNEA
jgi:ABC-type iron transport system FetAB ATPase subunit